MTHSFRRGKGLVSAVALAVAAFLLSACTASLNEPRLPSASAQPADTGLEPTQASNWDRLAELPWPQGGQQTYKSYDDSRRIFWSKLYPEGGTELYCGVGFDAARRATVPGQKLSVEHAFPADAIAETAPGCTDRTCKEGRVQRAMADLQNLWPALQSVNSSRGRTRFGVLPATTKPRFPDVCPAFRRDAGPPPLVEPRDAVKGDVARSLVYMHFVYGLPLEQAVSDRDLLLTWMRIDPPDAEEVRRNALIDQLQGTTNPLLDPAFMGM
jgi:deoxyribonuclease-1